ncbi:hypothetical protein CARUB_v10003131mg [Capsella rubella]|uniref:Ubiquitin-like domain-containing protein n=1 Tax=Capsella rubella TaxID=81985 RepID=R0GZW6_9BRAS|nr:hypothetical protein CARUB_v10003131mg [Capsella rubella]
MKLFIDTESGSSFSIDVDFLNTLLMIKQKIEESQGIPVCRQTLFFQGEVLPDNFKIRLFHIVNNSRLFLYIFPEDNNDDQVPQTEQSPLNPNHGFVNHQDFPVMSNKPEESPFEEFFGIQDSPHGKNNQMLHQTEQSGVCNQNQHVTTQNIMARRIDSGSSRPSYSLDDVLGVQDLRPETVGSRGNMNQVVQTETSSPSDSVKEFLRILDSPVKKKIKTIPSIKLTVFVEPFGENRKIPVMVNADDNVEELRKELVNMQAKGELSLPHEGYYFIFRELTLNETESFMWNLVIDGDTIAIIPKIVIQA